MGERATRWLRRLLPMIATLLACAGRAHADGGVLVLDDADGPFLITAFAAPAPLRAGPVDLSVLVRDARTGRPILGAEGQLEVLLELERTDRGVGGVVQRVDHASDEHAGHEHAGHDMGAGAGAHPEHGSAPDVLRATATREAATNKLLRAALVTLPASGEWRLTVRVSRAGGAAGTVGVVHTTLVAGPPLPAWMSRWKSLLLPPLVVALFLLNQFLAQRRGDARAERAATRPSRSSAPAP